MIFVDTGAFLARYDAGDQHHRAAEASWNKLRGATARLLTSNFVLDETITLLGRRCGYRFAADKARRIYASPTFEILRPEAADELRAVELFHKYADHEVSFTDCVNFALIAKRKVREAFAFDRHFHDAGFALWR